MTAAAIATVHGESGGRAVLGIGRGDSALAHLGRAPAPVAVFERYVAVVQAYLRGEPVTFDEASADLAGAPSPVGSLGLAKAPADSRLHWVGTVGPKVPVAVVGTGPKVLAVGARHAERVTLAVGADPERVAWGRQVVDDARRAAGLSPGGASIGAYVNVVAHPDPAIALELGSGGLATFARFSTMHGSPAGPVADVDRGVLEEVHARYDMTSHTQAGSPQAGVLTPGFAARFAVYGPSAYCVDRLLELRDLGLDHLVVVGPSADADRAEATAARRRFAAEVLPALRS